MNKCDLGKVSIITMGQSPPSETYNNACIGLPFFQGKTDFSLIHPSVRVYCAKPQKTAQSNDILISVRAPVGTTNIANQECCIGRGLAAITTLPDVAFYKYIFYYLRYCEKEIEKIGVGSTFKAINKKDLECLQIYLPQLYIQQKIATILDCVSNLIEKRKAQIEKLDLLVKSQFIEMFGDPVTNPMGWKTVTLNDAYPVVSKGKP
ncbi:MAG: restriction endonuclease subunit S, partial [Nitrososphaerota archaeon]|nr:restriction endonuclease subunit S [Nitrososphaerota archaeon]